MRTLVLWLFWIQVALLACKLFVIGRASYPRVVKWTRGEDSLGIAAGVAWIGLIAWILWGPQ
jgi:hypothetical protein